MKIYLNTLTLSRLKQKYRYHYIQIHLKSFNLKYYQQNVIFL